MNKLLISSFLVSDVSESLRSLTKNERPWAIRSGRSEEMSDVSELLILLTKNERMSESLIFLSESLIRSFLGKKQMIHLENRWANSQPCENPLLTHDMMYWHDRHQQTAEESLWNSNVDTVFQLRRDRK